MITPTYQIAVAPVITAFEEIGVAYHIGGSVAMSAHGVPRSTLDIDLIADIRNEHVMPLVERLTNDYYIDDDMILEAIAHKSSFNLIHFATQYKVDVFVLKSTVFAKTSFMRADVMPLIEDPEAPFYFIASAEDTILNKLIWYHDGGRLSDRQWTDVLNMLKVQQQALDYDYLRYWAQDLGVLDLLESAIDQSTFP